MLNDLLNGLIAIVWLLFVMISAISLGVLITGNLQ